MASEQDPYSEYSNVLDRFDKLKKSFVRLVEDNRKLQDKRAKFINPYEQKLSVLTEENFQLKRQLELRNRWDRENLPDQEQEFIRDFIEKHSQSREGHL